MRLAILSDIHGNLLALDAVLQDLKEAGGADKMWILGDLVAFGPRPAECMARLRDLKEAKVIVGNTDRYVFNGDRRSSGTVKDEKEWQSRLDNLITRDANFNWTASQLKFADYEYFSKLRQELDLEVPDYGWVIGYHGAPGSDEVLMWPETPDEEVADQFIDREGRLGFGGHTHMPMDRDLGRWRVVNVGSIGFPRDEARACYVLATFADGGVSLDFRRVSFDVDGFVKDLEQQGNPSWRWIVENIKR